MKIQDVIVYDKQEDIPEKYLESILNLQQKKEADYYPFEAPSLEYFRKAWKVPELSWVKNLRFVGVDEHDNILGYAWLGWNTKYDNLEQSWHNIYLQDSKNKRYNIRAIFKKIVNSIPDHIKTMYAWHLTETSQEKFYDLLNKDQSYEEILYLANLEELNLKEVSSKARKYNDKVLQKGYEIIIVDGLDYKNHVESYPKFVHLIECIWNDMPREKLTEEDAKMTPERYDELCSNNLQKWENFFSLVAIEKKTGDPVGVTASVIGNYQTEVAWQWETGVIHEHRGNRLGLALKYQMLERLLKETKAKFWYTGSSSVNVHMHKINETIGYNRWNSEKVYEFTKKELHDFTKTL